MPRAAARAAAAAGWALLGALALAGLLVSALAAWSASAPGRAAIGALLTRELDGLVAGRITAEAIEVLPSGVEVRGLRLVDPEGRAVISIPRAHVRLDLSRLGRRQVGLTADLDAPSVLLEAGRDGRLSLVSALSPPPGRAPARPRAAPAGPSWRLELPRVTARGGEVRWLRGDGRTALEATALELEAAGTLGGGASSLDVRVRAALAAPLEGTLTLEGAARLAGGRLELPVLEVALGATEVSVAGEADVRTGAFRAVARRLGLAATDARRLARAVAPGGDVAGAGYAESDGALATAALEVPPGGGAAPAGSARLAAAVRLAATRPALGFDVALAAFDPSCMLAQAPPARLDLTARGAASGRGLSDARGRVALLVAPSRLRAGELGPVALVARADGGVVDVEKLEARLPGLSLVARGRWRARGAVGGELALDAPDLARLGRNLAALTGEALPPVEGRLRARAALAGTGEAPSFTAAAEAPVLAAGPARAEALALSAEGTGPLRTARVRVSGRAARAEVLGTEARGLELSAALGDAEARFSLAGSVPSLGPEPVALEATARLLERRTRAEVRTLSLRWPGARYELVRPAAVTLAPPSVDRLALASGPRSVALSGGVRAREALDARLEVVRFDLAALPPGLVPLDAVGELSVDARATGTVRAPIVAAHLDLAGGALGGLDGLQALGDVRWDGKGRLAGEVGLLRDGGGALQVVADVPLPLRGARPAEPVAIAVDASAWPVEALRRAAGMTAPALTGTLGGRLALSGTAAAPRMEAALGLDGAALAALGPLAAAVQLDAAAGEARLTAATRLAGAPLADLDARVPLDLAEVLRRPAAALRALAHAPLTGSLGASGFQLAALAGKSGLPEGIAGLVTGRATLAGTPSAPRGEGTLSLVRGALAGYQDVAARLDVTAEAARTALSARASIGGAEALRAEAALGAPVERLADAAARRAAPLSIEATVPPISLARAAGPALPLAGSLSAHLVAKGTLARPEARLDVDGRGVEVSGRPLGDLAAVVRHEGPTTTAEVSLRPTAGGTLWAGGTLSAPAGLDDARALRDATAKVDVKSDRLDLGFLPALAPGLVRKASGLLTVDLSAAGPLAGLRPRGTVKLEGGRLAIVELGDWSDVEVVASLGDRAIEVSRLDARQGAGRLSARLAARDLGTDVAKLDGRVELRQLTVRREGLELATLDLPVELSGTLSEDRLDATVTLPSGTIRLPKKSGTALQAVHDRDDIVEADAPAKPGRSRLAAAMTGGSAGGRPPLEARCRVVFPGKLVVRSERPAVNIELKGDSTWRVAGGELTVDGSIEVVRGTVEPISGRVFHVERGRLTFPGAPVAAAQLDVAARYDNPVAEVTVTIAGVVTKPSISFSSRPPLDEGQIAMLIATGRTELNVNTGGVSTVTAQDATQAVAGAAMSAVFTSLVADKLPVDQLSIDTSRVRAGKYVTDKLFVGYAYRFDAKPEEGENVNEVKAEYHLGPRWNFELRYGDAQSGDASLIWSKDY